MVSVPDELRFHYHDGRLIPFVGAGVSMSVSWDESGTPRRGPSWSELVNQAATDLGVSDPALLRCRGTDLQILEYYRMKHGSAAKLTHWLYCNMRPPDDSLINSAIHRELAQLDKARIIYTTNFDDFLERSFELLGRHCSVAAVEADMARATGCEIVKFHGDLNHPDNMVLSESDYESRLKFSTSMDYRLRSDLLNRAVLFLGYSFRDSNVAYLFRLVNDTFAALPDSSTGRRAYIVVADPSDFEITLFRARNIEVIGVDGSSMTSEIAALLRELRTRT